MAGDHFSGHAADYAKFRPGYPEALFDWIAAQTAGHDLAWDCGCGNGQATAPLAERYARVVGTDLSPQQIAAAQRHIRASSIAPRRPKQAGSPMPAPIWSPSPRRCTGSTSTASTPRSAEC